MSALTKLSRNKAYDGHITKYSHNSAELACTMQLNVFLPKAADHGKVPAIYCLAGLTCTEDNFAQKAGALREAAKHGLALIFPDTSPSEFHDWPRWQEWCRRKKGVEANVRMNNASFLGSR
ncbi:Alpha/Beta hydrolase protein [Jimgerdemannia flammicorona]|uniref:S-formylglutathione hydrolase n=1 Tax=Jimgerdemannia flammicorona TaxID=994334 RepID=A0A433D2S2_9FUNG|nr:Alpha/Beta hydrolase protein [Jimgerdemannia flammicorona]